MAKKTKEAEETVTAVEEAGGGGKKVVLVAAVVVALALLGAGAMAGGLIGGGADPAQAAEPAPTPTPTAAELGMIVELESLTINLADGRFLKVRAAVEMAPDVAAEPATAPIYDALIAEFNRRTVDELTDPAIRAGTKDTLLASLSDIYGEEIVGVYYTEFVMQ